jgi:hypothetical protein
MALSNDISCLKEVTTKYISSAVDNHPGIAKLSANSLPGLLSTLPPSLPINYTDLPATVIGITSSVLG